MLARRRPWLVILRCICIAGVFGLVTLSVALAQVDPRFQSILARPQHRDTVIATVQQSTTWAKQGCVDASFALLPSVRTWRQPVFGPAGRLIGGV